MKTICITGITGYLGLATCYRLVQAGHKVVGVGSRPERPEQLPDGVEYAGIDIRDAVALEGFFTRHNVGTVYHFAAIKYVGKCEAEPELCFDINTKGTEAVLAAMVAAKVEHIVYASTYAVYDWSGVAVHLKETSPTVPKTIYGQSKLQSEQHIIDLEKRGLIKRYHILRYGNIVGAIPELSEHIAQSFLDKIVTAARTGEKIAINGDDCETADGSVARDFIDIRDVVTANELVLNAPDSAIYNISSGSATTLKMLITTAERIAGSKIPLQINPRNANEPDIITIDHQPVTIALSWVPQYQIEETIELLYSRISA